MLICLSVTKTPQSLRIAPSDHQAYHPSSLSTIEPTDHQDYQPLSLLTSGLLSQLLSLLACLYSIKNLYGHFLYRSPGSHCCNYSKNPDNFAVAASVACILAEDPLTVVEDDNDLHDEQFDLEEAAEVVELLHTCPLGVVSDVPEIAGD